MIEQIQDRDYFYKKAKLDGSEDSWNIAKHLRNVTNANIRQAKRDFVLGELENCQRDCKKFWSTIRSVIPSNKGDARNDIMLKNNGTKLNKDEVAHYINDYFIDIGKRDKTANAASQGPQLHGLIPIDDTQQPWSPEEFTVDEVLKVVKDINVSKSSGLDNISRFLIKEVFTILISQVTFMFNLSLRTSTFPKSRKEALVIPIPKTGNLTQVQNYRPISLLPLPGKLLEILMHKQFSDYVEEESYITKFQHGFRKHHSTIHSVAQVTKFINSKMDVGMPTLATFVDFRKAFDCVQHDVLLKKLRGLGVDGKTLCWFESYLTGRKQRVLANNTYSSFQTITQSVPQGSVLGPLFYILYANDIVNIIEHCEIALYADDTVLYLVDRDFGNSIGKMRKDIGALSNWCIAEGINMNSDKTKLMVFGSLKQLTQIPAINIQVEGSLIKKVPNYKYLGVTLDGNLNYCKHVNKTIAAASQKFKQFRRMRSFLNTKAATLVYKNMILPIIEYGDIFLVGATIEKKRKLQTLQNRGLRCALKMGLDAGADELHAAATLLPLKYRREQHLMNYMYDMSTMEENVVKRREGGPTTRSQKYKTLRVKKPRTEKFRKSLAYRQNWNRLPGPIRESGSKEEFKREVEACMQLKAMAEV